MLQSVKEERARHFQLAMRVGIPLLLFVFLMAYAVFFHEDRIEFNSATLAIFAAMVFVIVYFIYFALELSRKETLLDRVTEGYHYGSFVNRVRRCRPRTLAAAQISNLSVINETFGVNRADRLLRTLVKEISGEVLQEFGREGWIGRKNGAEFLIAADGEPEEIEKKLEEFFKTHTVLEDVEVDCAFAVIRNNIENPEKAIEQLRDLLVRRSSESKQAPVFAVSDARKLSEEEMEVVRALENRALSLQFRPLKNLRSGRADIFEVVVKMKAQDGRFIAPRDFLPIINRHDLGGEYDLLIFEQVLQTAGLIDEKISLSFNLSPFSLRKEIFIERFFEMLEKSGVSPSRLIVELYERKRHHRLEEYLERLKILKRRGIRLCLDNFGSSNASMEYIRHFHFDMIQFDRDYTLDLGKEENLSILKSFISMAHEMNMLTGAKWVDSQEKVAVLERLGVDYIQGYAAGRVMDESEFISVHNPLDKGV